MPKEDDNHPRKKGEPSPNQNSFTLLSFHSTETESLLQTTLTHLEHVSNKKVGNEYVQGVPFVGSVVAIGGRAVPLFPTSDEDDEGGQLSSSSSSEEEREEVEAKAKPEKSVPSPSELETKKLSKVPVDKKKTTSKRKAPKRIKDDIVRQMGRPPSILLPLHNDEADAGDSLNQKMGMDIPAALFPKGHVTADWDRESIGRECLKICRDIGTEKKKTVVVLLIRTGRFAGGVFRGGNCIAHTTHTRYTVRRGQGGAQSTMDSAKGKAKSMGAQLRRQGEISLQTDITNTLSEWKRYFEEDESSLIFLSCPKTMKKGLFQDNEHVFSKNDERIRSIPLDVGRPSFETVCAVYDVMMSVSVRHMTGKELGVEGPDVGETAVGDDKIDGRNNSEDKSVVARKIDSANSDQKIPKDEVVPLTPLHEAAASGDVEQLTKLLQQELDMDNSYVNLCAGEMQMTPLHCAAAASTSIPTQSDDASKIAAAASCVTTLLVIYHADPCIFDKHSRPPYYVATSDKVRDAFRMARHELGEDYCLWDDDAKVGPPLSKEDVQKRKAKAAEKKKRQRKRQKEKKMKEKAEREEEERKKREEEESKVEEENAKRVRDGLKPKKRDVEGIVCDFCQKDCSKKKKSQLFQRLEYVYCSTDCVKKHQRELTSRAALARLGG